MSFNVTELAWQESAPAPIRLGTCGHHLSRHNDGPRCFACQAAEDERQSQFITYSTAHRIFGIMPSVINAWVREGTVRTQGTSVHIDDIERVTAALRRPKVESERGCPPKLEFCQRGHRFDEANTLIGGDGRRRCRACQQARKRRVAGSGSQRAWMDRQARAEVADLRRMNRATEALGPVCR